MLNDVCQVLFVALLPLYFGFMIGAGIVVAMKTIGGFRITVRKEEEDAPQ